MKSKYGFSDPNCPQSRGWIAWLFLMVFLNAQLLLDFHVSLDTEEHENNHCTAEKDTDECHLAVFHDDQINGCQHEQHFFATELDCHLCDMLAIRHDLSAHTPVVCSWHLPNTQPHFTLSLDKVYIEPQGSHPHRGPPFV